MLNLLAPHQRPCPSHVTLFQGGVERGVPERQTKCFTPKHPRRALLTYTLEVSSRVRPVCLNYHLKALSADRTCQSGRLPLFRSSGCRICTHVEQTKWRRPSLVEELIREAGAFLLRPVIEPRMIRKRVSGDSPGTPTQASPSLPGPTPYHLFLFGGSDTTSTLVRCLLLRCLPKPHPIA